MAECWELFDRKANPIGQRIRRGDPIPQGAYHKIIGVWTIHTELKRLLTTRRDFSKLICPGQWENTGGSILCGETPAYGAAREVREETGLACEPHELEPITYLTTENALVYAYAFRTTADPTSIHLQQGETIDYAWVTLAELETRMADGSFALPEIRQYQACRPYLEKMLQGH